MVLLLNAMPWIIIAIGALCTWKFKKWWIPFVALVVLLVYGQARPSYVPMGVVERNSIPQFEQREGLEVRDISIKPDTKYDERRNEMINDGLPFIEKGEK